MNLNTDDVYVVTESRCANGYTSTFPVGSRVRLHRATVDDDGDVYAENIATEQTGYLLPECLSLENAAVSILALKAALTALGVEADVIKVAQSIDKALA